MSSNGRTSSRNDSFETQFAELVPPMKREEAAIEANRCLYCFDAPCVTACPTHISIPRFIKQIATQNLIGSAKTILEANALGHSCARICPVEVLCEGACVYLDWHKKPIQIARLQRYATDFLHKEKARPFKAGADNGHKVAVIGAGPAGLSCAFYLRRLGHPVTIFEKEKLGGGLNTYGIAQYKMTQETAVAEVSTILALGAQFRAGAEVGKTVQLGKLESEFSAIFVGIGLAETRSLRIPGENLPGVWDALTFVRLIKARKIEPLGKSDTTVVIGAGNTAIDAVTQAKRLGAKRVIMAYRRTQEEMSAYGYEFELAKQDEIEFLWSVSPTAILGKDRVKGIRFSREGQEFEVECDRVIKAIGQTKHYSVAKAAGLSLDESGRIIVDTATMKTSNPRYYAGGDAINGGKEVVNAVADGKRAAWSIHRALTGENAPSPENAYWVSTIDARNVAPIAHAHVPQKAGKHG